MNVVISCSSSQVIVEVVERLRFAKVFRGSHYFANRRQTPVLHKISWIYDQTHAS